MKLSYRKLYIDNNEFIAGNPENWSNLNYSIYVFAINMQGRTYDRYTNIKLYSFQIFDVDNLVRDYIPVIDSTSRPCLFDKVNRECYYNQGSGEFLYG